MYVIRIHSKYHKFHVVLDVFNTYSFLVQVLIMSITSSYLLLPAKIREKKYVNIIIMFDNNIHQLNFIYFLS